MCAECLVNHHSLTGNSFLFVIFLCLLSPNQSLHFPPLAPEISDHSSKTMLIKITNWWVTSSCAFTQATMQACLCQRCGWHLFTITNTRDCEKNTTLFSSFAHCLFILSVGLCDCRDEAGHPCAAGPKRHGFQQGAGLFECHHLRFPVLLLLQQEVLWFVQQTL